jgi:hypothetical protein
MRAAGFRPIHSSPQAPVENEPNAVLPAAAPMNVANRDPNFEILQVLKTLQESIASKDSIIQQLQETIKGLNAQIAAMGAAITSMQQAAATAQSSPPQPWSPNAPGATAGTTASEASAAS